jgi:hypothetical protein
MPTAGLPLTTAFCGGCALWKEYQILSRISIDGILRCLTDGIEDDETVI